ncbi:imidazole glycerol phosphate synthase, glutamine amidotransferase subunit [Desulfatibacillum aliphaticivorans]|uniref:Imidazole glycerol phosphate synthase subunit HisH n=1 Tax=Desulfatibacillum aliphaticivorans TaxID=218208 RepID=B8F9S0_DESAL|nr:imidazole glycerol phosphate synthase subunit HisH [Desulfatibacillum aliphaticivorans]ACL03016.1 imidazole glycerol phosphate synthase, glutamine amidotransferase subunit [Desulfatibacillum aliphaticivorans]
MIGIINYGLGNIKAFSNIYHALNIPAKVICEPGDLENVEKLILPGVGAFDRAMTRFEESGLKGAVVDAVMEKERPVLGICVGMQMMADGSEEGTLKGLGWIPGFVRRFNVESFTQKTNLPHMGWNDIVPIDSPGKRSLGGLVADARFYFLHSYYFDPVDDANTLALTDYNFKFASAVGRRNFFGVQFHPEKSHEYGIQLLKSFAEI